MPSANLSAACGCADPDFEEFVSLDEEEDLAEIFPAESGKVLVSGTAAPVSVPKPEAPEPEPAAGAARALTLLCHAELVGKTGTKITVDDVSTLAELLEKLRVSEKMWEGVDFIPTPGTPLVAHKVEGSAIGAAYASLDEVKDKSKICVKVAAGGGAAAAAVAEEAVPALQVVVMVSKNEIVKENKKLPELTVASIDDLCEQMKVACEVTDANVAVFKVRGTVPQCELLAVAATLGLADLTADRSASAVISHRRASE